MRGGRCYNATRAVWSIVLDLGYKVDPETGEFMCVDGPKGFATWEEAEEAGRFLRRRVVIAPSGASGPR